MKKRILFLLTVLAASLGSRVSYAQIALSPTDTQLCPGDTLTIHASFASSLAINNSDDFFTNGVFDIGFPFIYYGDTVTQFVISANNFISFDLSLSGSHSAYIYSSAVNNGELDNAIMFPYHDLNFAASGGQKIISYQTFGTAPNRKLVVEFCSVPLFGCNSLLVTDELILYESSNIIEMHITQKPAGCSWAGGTGIEGLRHNNLSDLVPGRNTQNVNWSATNDGRSFTPNGTTAYIIDTIPFNPTPIIQNADSNEVVWYKEGNPNPIDTGASTTVIIEPNVQYYLATITGQSCNSSTNFVFIDTCWIHNTSYDTLTAEICQGDSLNFHGTYLNYSGTFDTILTTPQGCHVYSRLYLTVNPLPIMLLADTATPHYFCKGDYVTLSIAQPSTNYNYQWERDGTPIAGATNSSISSIIAGDYRLFVNTIHGCTDSSKLITVIKDSVEFDFDILSNLGCAEDTVHIINNGEPGVSYAWDFGDGSYPLDTLPAPTHIYDQQGTYQVKLIKTDFSGCVDSMLKIIKINHPLNADFTVSKDSLCQDETIPVQFTNASIGAQYYQWDFGDGSPVSNQLNPSHNYNLAGNHIARLIALDTLGCSDTAFHSIYVDSLPSLALIADPINICTGEELNLLLDYLAETATKVSWRFGDGIHWEEADQTHHRFEQAGNYQVTVTVDYPVCTSTHDTVLITVNDMPLIYLGQDTVLCLQGAPIELKNLAANPNPATLYKWNTGDTSASISVTHPGLYTLTATLFDCSSTESVVINKDCYVDIPNAFTPNGDGDNDYFLPRKFLSKGVTNFNLVIYNRWGQKIFETQNAQGRGWDGKYNEELQPSGVYVYQIQVQYSNGRSENYSGNLTLIR